MPRYLQRPYWLPGGVSATPFALGTARRSTHIHHVSLLSTELETSRKVQPGTLCQSLPKRVVNIAFAGPGAPISVGGEGGLSVTTLPPRDEDDARPSKKAMPAVTK